MDLSRRLRFDTRMKKPKLYSIAVLTGFLAVLFVFLWHLEESTRIKWANLALAVYFALVIVLLIRGVIRQMQYNPYSYNTMIYTGFALFCLYLMGVHVKAAVQCFSGAVHMTEEQMIRTLAWSARDYMRFTAPFLFLFAGALFVSNISLIRHEGKRFVNILGIILAFLLVAGELVINWLSQLKSIPAGSIESGMSIGLMRALRTRAIVINGAAVLYLYFECMIIGAIVADVIAALYEPEHDKDFLIVLGCRIKQDGTPTNLLKGRVDLALRFWQEQLKETGREAVFVCSGGQGPDEVCSEAASMAGYLRPQGIRDELIILEDRSRDTAENMKFSKEKIFAKDPDAKIAFFTTNYHVFRAGLKSRRVKMRSQGMGADTKWYFWPNAAVREFVGLITEHRGKQALILLGLLLVYGTLTFLTYM